MTTLLELRTKLNGEIGVTTDGDTTPWSTTVRNNAISDGYADLWRVGVRKPVTESASTSSTSWTYALTSIEKLDRLEIYDSSSQYVDRARGIVEPDGSGGYQVHLSYPIDDGYTLTVRGWARYVSTFANDSASDDLPSADNRVPLLKAKAILYRAQLASFIRYGDREVAPAELNVTTDQLLAIIAASEREYQEAARALAAERRRSSQIRSL